MHGRIDPGLPLVVIRAKLGILIALGELFDIGFPQELPVHASLFELFIDVWEAAQHGLHTAAWLVVFPGLAEKVFQFLIIQGINFFKGKAALLKDRQVLPYGIPG